MNILRKVNRVSKALLTLLVAHLYYLLTSIVNAPRFLYNVGISAKSNSIILFLMFFCFSVLLVSKEDVVLLLVWCIMQSKSLLLSISFIPVFTWSALNFANFTSTFSASEIFGKDRFAKIYIREEIYLLLYYSFLTNDVYFFRKSKHWILARRDRWTLDIIYVFKTFNITHWMISNVWNRTKERKWIVYSNSLVYL